MIKKINPDALKYTVKKTAPAKITAPPITAAPDSAPPAPIYAPEDYKLARMMANNPDKADLIAALIGRFDLVSSATRRKVVPATSTADQAEKPAPGKIWTLEGIAAAAFTDGRAYSESEALTAIGTLLQITTDRARAGFARLLEGGHIERAGNGYFLAGSTPF